MGFHAARIPIIDVALWDTAGTVGVAYVASRYSVFGVDSFAKQLLIWFGLGFAAHVAFGVNTRVVDAARGWWPGSWASRPWWARHGSPIRECMSCQGGVEVTKGSSEPSTSRDTRGSRYETRSRSAQAGDVSPTLLRRAAFAPRMPLPSQ